MLSTSLSEYLSPPSLFLDMAAPSPAVAAEIESLDRILTRLALIGQLHACEVRLPDIFES